MNLKRYFKLFKYMIIKTDDIIKTYLLRLFISKMMNVCLYKQQSPKCLMLNRISWNTYLKMLACTLGINKNTFIIFYISGYVAIRLFNSFHFYHLLRHLSHNKLLNFLLYVHSRENSYSKCVAIITIKNIVPPLKWI